MTDEPRQGEARRARRRRDLLCMKAKARRIRPDNPATIKDADHLAVCSCWMCGHRRRIDGLTMQERRAFQVEGEL